MNSLDGVVRALRDVGLPVIEDAPFGALTTYGTGGTAAVMVTAGGVEELRAVGRAVAASGPTEVFVLGNGSNTLVSDEGFTGVVVRLPAAREGDGIELSGDGMVTAQGRTKLPVLARRSVAAGWCGLEWAVGVPGTVGGAVRMNAGGHGAETLDSLEDARVVSLRTGHIADIAPDCLGLRFRGSALRDWHVVVSARFRVSARGAHRCEDELAAIVAWRRENQPGGRNAGSVFVNPAPGKGSSGALIDACGLRGLRRGGASVSDRHANFIQAGVGATSRDIIEVMTAVQDEVADRTGVLLHSETRLVGFGSDVSLRFTGSAPGPVDVPAGCLADVLGES